jgi:anti-sigma B factor antagonist
MILRQRTVTVRQLPAMLDDEGRKEFWRLLRECIDIDRPRVVFDCCLIRELDASAIHFLLCCLEEAMKRNGDIRLAALTPNARASLKSAGVEGILEPFDTIADAVDSYTQPLMRSAFPDSVGGNAVQAA